MYFAFREGGLLSTSRVGILFLSPSPSSHLATHALFRFSLTSRSFLLGPWIEHSLTRLRRDSFFPFGSREFILPLAPPFSPSHSFLLLADECVIVLLCYFEIAQLC